MARDYKKENAWQASKYETIIGKIDKELGIQLKEKLKQDGKTVTSWITENAKKYLKKS